MKKPESKIRSAVIHAKAALQENGGEDDERSP
jgi:hypothetical protein